MSHRKYSYIGSEPVTFGQSILKCIYMNKYSLEKYDSIVFQSTQNIEFFHVQV